MYKPVIRVIVNNRELELWTISTLARYLDRSVETIRYWERMKIIPPPMYKNKNVRLYHPKEAETMKKVVKKLGKYAKKEALQQEMWEALAACRREIRDESEGKSSA